jgi:SAM-dependent methyltransferase
MRKELADCRTCLDVGCGNTSDIPHLGFEYTVGVEYFAPALEKARQERTHNDFCCANINDLNKHFSENQFDCAVALDVVEHLTKEDGLRLLKNMERIARKKILLFTPNGFLPQDNLDDNPLQVHRSGWTAKEMKLLGFKVIGMYGPKFLRGEQHRHRLRPERFWGGIAALMHFCLTRWQPGIASAILCVKEKPGNPVSDQG